MIPKISLFALAFLAACCILRAAPAKSGKSTKPSSAANIISDIPYGPHARQKYDIHLPEGKGPFPIVVFIHGGGWVSGDKVSKIENDQLKRVLANGCAFASIEYRLLKDAEQDAIFPPVLAPLNDAKTALQHLRHNAARWNLDPRCVVVFGGSAGACTSLWIALAPDMADPASPDPVARESTRVLAVGAIAPQTCLDPWQMREWVGPKLQYGHRAFGLASFEKFHKRRDEFAKYYPLVSPAALLSPDDPPIYISSRYKLDDKSNNSGYHTHSPRFGLRFRDLAIKIGIPCELYIPESPETPKEDIMDFLIRNVTAKTTPGDTSTQK